MKRLLTILALGVLLVSTPANARTQPISLDEKLSKLSMCESSRRADIKVLDSNGKYSYGILQFQKDTFRKYSARYGLRDSITEEDLYNPSLQREVAKRMILETPKNWNHWRVCATRLGFL